MGVEEQLPDARTDSGLVLLPQHTQFDRATAGKIVGGLSRTTKMPCHSWGLPAWNCTTGGRLAAIEGSVCHDCYARKGKYRWQHVKNANDRRLAQSEHPNWVAAMSMLVQWQSWDNAQPYFRWFDTGDLQSTVMLERIAAVASATPNIKHWLPTKEYELVEDYFAQKALPANLTLRVSASMIDQPPPTVRGVLTSTVHRDEPPIGYKCPAYNVQPASCGPCRACWDSTVANVSYPYH